LQSERFAGFIHFDATLMKIIECCNPRAITNPKKMCKKRLKHRCVLVCLIAALCKLAIAQNIDFDGQELRINVIGQATPESEVIFLGFETLAIVDQRYVEFPSIAAIDNPASGAPPGFSGQLVDVAIDVSTDTLTIDFDNAPPFTTFASGFQNTYVFTFLGANVQNIGNAQIDRTVTNLNLEDSDVTVEGNQLFVNVESLTFNADTFIKINFEVTQIDGLAVRDAKFPNFDREMNFGEVSASSGNSHSVSLQNTTDDSLTVTTISISDSNPDSANAFQFVNDLCTGASLTIDSICSFDITFSPTEAREYQAELAVTTNGASTTMFSVSGEGVTSTVANIVLRDESRPTDDRRLDFGETVPLGSTVAVPLTIVNSGTADLIIGNIAEANTLVSQFTLDSDGCSGAVITPDAECSFSVIFMPDEEIAFTDTFDIPSNDPDEGFVVVTATGTGVLESEPSPTTGVEPPVESGSPEDTAPNDAVNTDSSSGSSDSGGGLASPWLIALLVAAVMVFILRKNEAR